MRFLLFSALILTLIPNAHASDYQSYVGKLYGSFRELLVFDNWFPAKLTRESDCFGKSNSAKCAAFPEILHCAGTGVAPCRMKWSKSNRILWITTASEIDMQVTAVEMESIE